MSNGTISNGTITFTSPGVYSNDTTNAWTSWVTTSYSNTITMTLDQAALRAWTGWITTEHGPRRVQRGEEAGWTQVEEVAELQAAVAAAAESRRVRRQSREEELREASRRAKELLISCLNAEQRAELEDREQFHVTAPSGRVYVIQWGYAGNVRSQGWRYCIHGPSDLPYADQMLMQKLLLETDEEKFLRVANASPDYEPVVVAA